MQDDKMKITLDEPTLVMMARYTKNIEARIVAQLDQLTEYFEQATDLQEIADVKAKIEELDEQLINVRHVIASVDNRIPDSLIVHVDAPYSSNKLIRMSDAAHVSVLLHFATRLVSQLIRHESGEPVDEDHPLAKILPFSDSVERAEIVTSLMGAVQACQLMLGQTPDSKKMPLLTSPLDINNEVLMSEIEYIEEVVFNHFCEAFIRDGIDAELVHSLFEMYQVEKMPESFNWPVVFSAEMLTGFYPMLRQYLSTLDGGHHFIARVPTEEATKPPESNLTADETDDRPMKLFLVAHCAHQISKLLTGTSDCGLDTTISPIKEHLHRVRVYGSADRWLELRKVARTLAQATEENHIKFYEREIAQAMDALEMLKPDFQANPDLMRSLYGFYDVLTGGAELRVFGIEGELPIG